MKIGLASYRCENRNMQFNIRQIERAMKDTQGKADLLCFGEAFLQGFDSLCWNYEKDRYMALLASGPVEHSGFECCSAPSIGAAPHRGDRLFRARKPPMKFPPLAVMSTVFMPLFRAFNRRGSPPGKPLVSGEKAADEISATGGHRRLSPRTARTGNVFARTIRFR